MNFVEQLAKVSFEIDSNEKVILKGKPGSGKSLLLQILAGIHHINDGEIYLNEVPISNYEQEELFSSFGVNFPVNQIFEGTFRENIVVGRDIPEEDLIEVVKFLKEKHATLIKLILENSTRKRPKNLAPSPRQRIVRQALNPRIIEAGNHRWKWTRLGS